MADNLNPQGAAWSKQMAGSGQAREVSPSVAALTERMTRGDESAFQEFFHGYFNRLLHYLLVMTHGREDEAREALQLTLVRVAKYVRRFDSEPAFWGWLTVLARSAVVDEQRKRRRYTGLLARFLHSLSPDRHTPKVEADGKLSELLLAELAGLPDDDRTLLDRKYEAELSVREIAAELGLTEKAAESRLTRARKKLKDAVLARLKNNE